ncbi:hypothetical protein HYC85_016283 [Camellia sinensis]|uniref:Uncharacterized protein n=1 Tax=Camellia sinensis TaxID=4442 RepID=A0A7J7H0M1_CAMSI|nr:hypothetical protein HYC85_016283 [Camellia sinensis]
MKNKAELVLVPTPATVLLIKPFFFPSYNLHVESLATSENPLRYIHLPPLPPSEPVVPKSPEKFFFDYLESHKSQVREAIINHVPSSSPPTARLAGMVVDFLCTAVIDVANEFAAPTCCGN